MKRKNFNILIIFLLVFTLISIPYYNKLTSLSPTINNSVDTVLVHFINVGQGDSILIQTSNENVLIDSGSNTYSKKLVNYLKRLNITNLDFIIATHPHEDHIGSMDEVIKNFEIGEFYAPKVTSSTEDFVSLVSELTKKHKKINIAKAGLIITLANKSYLKFLSPTFDKYENLNNYSTVIKFQNKENSFLFTGDSEKIIEDDLIRKNQDISCNVLKVGHHGSKTSTSKEFLTKANPNFAVILCGMGNDYGHPHKEVLKSLKDLNITTFRTDKNGTIIFSSNGKNISTFCEKN
jgi:competence protein ComEC